MNPHHFLLPLFLSSLTTAYTGDMTHYTPGVGSCGYTSGPNDAVVALSVPMMRNPPDLSKNRRCGTKIGIWNPSTRTHHWATIVDTCQECKYFDTDVSEGLFRRVAPTGDGRVHGINWGGSAVGG